MLKSVMPATRRPNSLRLSTWDYREAGSYSVTINAHEHQLIFGTVIDGEMVLNNIGALVDAQWRKLHRPDRGVYLDIHIVMPNHLHGIVILTPPPNLPPAIPAVNAARGSLGALIASFKGVASRAIRRQFPEFATHAIWQRNYRDRIIRNEAELHRARTYILNNPLQWEIDYNNPSK